MCEAYVCTLDNNTNTLQHLNFPCCCSFMATSCSLIECQLLKSGEREQLDAFRSCPNEEKISAIWLSVIWWSGNVWGRNSCVRLRQFIVPIVLRLLWMLILGCVQSLYPFWIVLRDHNRLSSHLKKNRAQKSIESRSIEPSDVEDRLAHKASFTPVSNLVGHLEESMQILAYRCIISFLLK